MQDSEAAVTKDEAQNQSHEGQEEAVRHHGDENAGGEDISSGHVGASAAYPAHIAAKLTTSAQGLDGDAAQTEAGTGDETGQDLVRRDGDGDVTKTENPEETAEGDEAPEGNQPTDASFGGSFGVENTAGFANMNFGGAGGFDQMQMMMAMQNGMAPNSFGNFPMMGQSTSIFLLPLLLSLPRSRTPSPYPISSAAS